MERERALRQKLKHPQKFYIKKIIFKGVSLLTEESLKQIILPFEKHWLSIQDIQLLIESISQAYMQKNHSLEPSRISYELKGKLLIIKIEE